MSVRLSAIIGALSFLVPFGGGADAAPSQQPASANVADLTAYVAELDSWKQQRVDFLKGPIGYLNLVGLFWLREGGETFGSSGDSNLVFPAKADPHIGSFVLQDGQVTMSVNDGCDVTVDGIAINSLELDDDSNGAPMVANHGDLAWTIIQRDGRFAVRLRDYQSDLVSNFRPPEYFDPDVGFRVPATLVRYAKPRKIRVDTVIAGLDYQPESPGVLTFEIDGQSYELEAYAAGEQLFLIFGDRTSGRGTYPAGRFLYADLPDEHGRTVLDFNQAYSPPCAYNVFATCPVASPRNRLATKIVAGERYEAGQYGH